MEGGGSEDGANFSCARVSELEDDAGGCDARDTGVNGGCCGGDGRDGVDNMNGSIELVEPDTQPEESGCGGIEETATAQEVTVVSDADELLSLTTVLSECLRSHGDVRQEVQGVCNSCERIERET